MSFCQQFFALNVCFDKGQKNKLKHKYLMLKIGLELLHFQGCTVKEKRPLYSYVI